MRMLMPQGTEPVSALHDPVIRTFSRIDGLQSLQCLSLGLWLLGAQTPLLQSSLKVGRAKLALTSQCGRQL